jgi:uncharacterized membrane protein
MWFWLAFASAILGSIDVIINKLLLHKVSAGVLTWSLFTLSFPPLIYFAFKDGIPSVNQFFFIGVTGSAVTFVFSKTITNQTLKSNLISKVFPLTAFSGLFTYLLGLLFLSESIRLIPVTGLMFIIAGSYILNAENAREDLLKPFKILFADKASVLFLFAILLNSITSIFDKTALNNTTPANAAFTLFFENIIMIIIMTYYLIKKRENNVDEGGKRQFQIVIC